MYSSNILIFGFAGGYEWILIILAVILLFGGRKIPELMKGLGQGMKEFKKAKNESASADEKKDGDTKEAIKE